MTDPFEMKSKLTDKAYAPNEEAVISRQIAGQTILVPIRGTLADMQKLYVLDTVGEFIWERLDGKRKVQELCADVVKTFEVGADEVKADLKEFLAALVNDRLVVERE